MNRRRRHALAGAALGAAMLPIAFAFAGGITVVSQIRRSFAVAAVQIRRGDTVRFTNDDKFDHQLYVDSPSFKFESAEQVPGTIKDILFTKAGVFDVQCEIHPRMHLTVMVD